MNVEFKINNKVLETDRLILRAFRGNDLDDFFEYASTEGVGEMAGWKHHKNKDTSKEILNHFIEDDNVFAVVYKDNDKVIGSLGVEKYKMEDELTEFNNLNGREIGYVLSKDYWGKGLMLEAANTVIDYLFNECDLDFIISGYYSFNKQSKKVQEKCGFKPYRTTVFNTQTGSKQEGILNLLLNPNKDIKLVFSHPETLIYK